MKGKSHLPGRSVGAIAARYAKDRPTKFYPTGLKPLDDFTGGLPSGELTLIAARPGVGKTALALQFLEHVGAFVQDPCGFFSFEMSGRALVTRMILSRTGLPSVALRKGELSTPQIAVRDAALLEIAKLPLHIDDSSVSTIAHIEKTAKAWIKGGVKFLALDYVQLMHSVAQTGDTRAGFVGECAWSLKEIAKRFDVPFVVLSQLNRDSEKSKSPPTLSNLKDSGDLEQTCDNAIILHPDTEDPTTIDCLLLKWRNGLTGVVTVRFDPERTRFLPLRRERT